MVMNAQKAQPLIKIHELEKKFPIRSGIFQRRVGYLPIYKDVSLEIFPGETVALVMPPKSGKSIFSRSLVQLEDISSGQVIFNGQNVAKARRGAQKTLRQKMQIIFDDPYMAINPRLTILDIVGEPLKIHNLAAKDDVLPQVKSLLKTVGLNPYVARRYPYELSGGQRQRVVLARALATNPSFLLLDDLFAKLDPLLIRPFTKLLAELKQSHNLTYLFLTSNLVEAKGFADRIGIFYLGEMVELTDADTLFSNPAHPYTQYLISQIPFEDYALEKKRQPIQIAGSYPDILHPPRACHFHPRCAYASDVCKSEKPEWRKLNTAVSHQVACHHSERFFE